MRVPHRLVRLAARAKPLVPASLWPLLLAARSVPGDGPLVMLPRFDRALVLAAHPDDEVCGCGGTIGLLAAAGTETTIVFVSDGSATHFPAPREEISRRRRREAETAAAILGASAKFLGLPDGRLREHLAEIRAAVASTISASGADVVFMPWFLDGHPDHEALSDALALDGELPPALEIWGYETWMALPPNRLIDITETFALKEKALAAHETAHHALELTAQLGLSRWRSMHAQMGRGHAEAFLALPANAYRELTKQARAACAP